MVICVEQGADCLHTVQLMPLHSQNSIISCLIYIQTGFTFLCQLTQVVLEKRPLNGSSSSSFKHSMLSSFWFLNRLVTHVVSLKLFYAGLAVVVYLCTVVARCS